MARELPEFTGPEALTERVGTAAVTADPEAGTDEHQVISWLTSLHLLQGVPFAYLVPDIRMLPAESIRFFQVDLAWIEALLDGAFSVGATRATTASGTVLRAATRPVVRARLPRVRAALVGTQPKAEPPEAISGFLLRSAVVSGWPGLEVRCYADTGGQQPLPLLRLEPVAPALLLCLVGGVLRRTDLQEPQEGVHFGVDPGPPGPVSWQKQLRYASGNATVRAGSYIPGGTVPVPLRPGTSTVLRIDELAKAMAPDVWAPPLPPPPPPPAEFTAAQFGLEMVEGVQSVSFQVGS